jgi:ADP-ribose pyrophosphatase
MKSGPRSERKVRRAEAPAIHAMSKAKILSQEVVFNGRLLKLRVDRIVEPAGHETTREIVVAPNAVSIVARPTTDQVILIRQYRHATGTDLLEVPAGGLHKQEDPELAAIRELEEETGYLAANMVHRGGFWMTPGFSTEFMYVFEATELTKTQIRPDEDEVIETEIVSNADAFRMIDDGRIQDSKSIASLLKILPRA